MIETTLDNWVEEKVPIKRLKNIFQIWKENDEKVPFAVRRRSVSGQYYTVVERIEIKKWPYGDAFGYPTINGQYSGHYEYSKEWRNQKKIPCSGCYQWTLAENVKIFQDFSIFDLSKSFKAKKIERTSILEKKGAYTFDEIRGIYPKAYAKWNPEDDENLKNLFKAGKSDEELASIFQRKIRAIESRLVKLGLKT
ncbi:hypothetical protein [Methanoregula sp.]|uniref:hypothetical protein n=1 Tax=Methanoregula sp. TaxID=2052170 RepID=UPI003C78B579